MPADPLTVFAANMRGLREAARISQEDLGLRAGVDMSNVSRYEAGKREPGVRTIARLAYGLGVSSSALLDGVEWAPDSTQ